MKAQKARCKFFLLAAMLLTGGVASAQVVIKGNVYGGCEVGVVSKDATVTINHGTVEQSVYGGGMGEIDDENKGLVQGNTNVVMSNGNVQRSIYGGGELGSVGTFLTFEELTYPDQSVHAGEVVRIPNTCQVGTGLATVKISGGRVGKVQTLMPSPGTSANDDDCGYVFCGGRGEADSITHYKALAMAVVNNTYLEISGSAVIAASAYGGSENGMVMDSTYVKMLGGQIGTGYYKDDDDDDQWDDAYTEEQWTAAIHAVKNGTINSYENPFHECDHWPYGWTNPETHQIEYNTYDIFYGEHVVPGDLTTPIYQPENSALYASDGHSFFGNLFGGGSGYYPIAPGVWRRSAGRVRGNTRIEIEGGHILTTVYGGNETTDVGRYENDGVTWISKGKSTIIMSGGTVGVPRTKASILGHPVTCSLFGGGMGDPRVWANTWTNVHKSVVEITGGTVFGSVFGGGEEGHVLSDVTVSISEAANADGENVPYTVIGSVGDSDYDGHVFGAGRGFSGEALTAGTIGGNSEVNISGGLMLGSVYGGGRHSSVGTYFTNPLDANYGQFVEDDPENNKTYGHTTVNISGGTIGNNVENAQSEGHTFGGNVYGGSMGSVTKIDNVSPNPLWPRLARVKQTHVNITGGTIKSHVYGGGEYGTVRDFTNVVIGDNNGSNPTIRKVFGGGYGSTETGATFYSNDSLAYPALLSGRVEGNTNVEIKSGTVLMVVYGGGELATVGFVKNGELKKGTSTVVVSGGVIGTDDIYTSANYYSVTGLPRTDVGHVFGGGQGKLDDYNELYKAYCNVNHTDVTVQGGTIYGSVFGGGADSHVLGNTNVHITNNPVIGTTGITSWDGNVFGGGLGDGHSVDGDFVAVKTEGRVGGNTNIEMEGGHVKGSIFGGGRLGMTGVDENGEVDSFLTGNVYDDENHGLATIRVSGGTIGIGGTDDLAKELLKSDESVGDIFGSGKGDTENYDDIFAGRVSNTDIEVTGNTFIYGSVFGGGEMAGVGYWNNSGTFYENTGASLVTIGSQNAENNPKIGTDYEFTMPSTGEGHVGDWTIYETIDGVTKLLHTATGNVYGGCQGDVDIAAPHWVSMGRSHDATVNIHGGTIKSSVFGGGEQGALIGDAIVNVTGGTIGKPSLTASDNTTYNFGSIFGGGYGSPNLEAHPNDSSNRKATDLAGRIYGNTTVNFSGGQVYENVYGGGNLASVGWVKSIDDAVIKVNGHCTVNVTGTAKVGPLDNTGLNAYVYGGGKGVGNDPDSPTTLNFPDEQFKLYCNVNSTQVIVELDYNNNANDGRVYGSLFGGGADGHVLGNASVVLKSGLIGTNGTTSWDGNIFGGGRNYLKKNYTAGRVGGNTNVVMKGGILLGSIFGGGRLGLTGVNEYGVMQEGSDHGKTYVLVQGGEVGNKALMRTHTSSTMGDVFGGGKGSMDGVAGHPAASALLVSLTKNTEVVIQDSIRDDNIMTSPKIYGRVYGGGEVANVGKYSWNVVTDPETGQPTIGDITVVSDGLAKVTVSGGQIGADRMEMNCELVDGVGKYDLKYNTDVGHVFGGGEGRGGNPSAFDIINPSSGTPGIHNNKSLLDLMATVNRTEVIIKDKAWVKGAVYGGSSMGHVLGNTSVKIQGGQIGAGNNGTSDENPYDDDKFFNPLTYFADDTHNDVLPADTLAECYHWPFGRTITVGEEQVKVFDPFNPIDIKNGRTPCDGQTWFGNVFGGGSGYYPYIVHNTETDTYEAQWNPEAGKVYGTSTVEIEGGHILTSVYGGCEMTDVVGNATVTMSGGTLGVPRSFTAIDKHPVTCYLFGSGKGNPHAYFNTWTNVANAIVNVSGGKIYGSVFGGGEEGHVFGNATVSVSETDANEPTIIGTTGRSYVDGNIFGGGRGFSGEAITAGAVGGNVEVNISGGTMLGSIYGGGRLASVGIEYANPTIPDPDNPGETIPNPNYGHMQNGTNHGTVEINITGGTIGNDYEAIYHTDFTQHTKGGNVYAGAMGRLTRLDGSVNTMWPNLGKVKETVVAIDGSTALIKGNVYGGGEFGTVEKDATITVSSGTIMRDVYGAGYGSTDITSIGQLMVPGGSPVAMTPMKLAGRVNGNTEINVEGGWIQKSVYGGGEMATVGVIKNDSVAHRSENTEFALSWPYKMNYEANTGKTEINVTGGRLGITGSDYMGPYAMINDQLTPVKYNDQGNPVALTETEIDDAKEDNGDVYGGGKGFAAQRYLEAHATNVHDTHITIEYTNNSATPTNYKDKVNGVYTHDCITGAVYGGGENGHVIQNTEITLTKGLVGHNIYGGGKGKGKYTTQLYNWHLVDGHYEPYGDPYDAQIYSITTGKVYGNTHVTMEGGYVVRNIFGGGNMASVGKGNYTGAPDDYSTSGYGETVTNATAMADTLNSGNTFVTIKGGQLGYLNPSDPTKVIKDGLPYGSVYGGCRGITTHDVPRELHPRIKYCPEDFLGYVNKTHVVIGEVSTGSTGGGTGDGMRTTEEPLLYGSVYGGGEDGHVRWDTHVTINKGEIGADFGNTDHPVANDPTIQGDANSIHWINRGNVYGAGSGIGQYTDENNVKHYSYISGSVTQFSMVDIKGGTIHNNVYGGGNLATVGPPRILQTVDCPADKTGVTVNIKGNAEIGKNTNQNSEYGGNVYGASRGIASEELGTDNKPKYKDFAYCSYTEVNVSESPVIYGAVFGGGENGKVGLYHEDRTSHVENGQNIHTSTVNINGGTIKHTVYGGGQGVFGDVIPGSSPVAYYVNDTMSGRVMGNVTVNLMGGTIGVDDGLYAANVFGGCRRSNIWGDATVYVGGLNPNWVDPGSGDGRDLESDPVPQYIGELTIYGAIYGANRYKGTPYGDATVNVYKTAHTAANTYPEIPAEYTTDEQVLAWLDTLSHNLNNFAIKAVFGGSDRVDYIPKAGKKATVNVFQCKENTIYDVYGGGNAAAVGSASVNYQTDANVNIYGGRIYRVFGGGNGESHPADVHGAANTTIDGGLINQVFGGSNNNGIIDEINLVVNQDATCPSYIVDVFGGGNSALIIGDVTSTVECGDASYANYYGGNSLANIYGNVTTNIFGANFTNVFGGSKGSADRASNIKKFPEVSNDVLNDPTQWPSDPELRQVYQYISDNLNAGVDLRGTGGNVTLNIFGGNIKNAFGGSDKNGAIDGKLQVNVFDVGDCNLNLENIFGAGDETAYTPNYGSEEEHYSPEINLIHGTATGCVFGGGKGEDATTYASPVVNIGYTTEMGTTATGLVKQLCDIVNSQYTSWTHPANYKAEVGQNVYGGGKLAAIEGNPTVNVNKSNTVVSGNVYGGGEGNNLSVDYAKITGDGTVIINDGQIKKNVFGGGQMSIITGDATVEMTGGTVGSTETISDVLYLHGSVYGGGQGSSDVVDGQGQSIAESPNFGRVQGNTYVEISGDAQVYKNVYGGGQMGSVGNGALSNNTTGVAHVTISGGQIGPFYATELNANVYGGGQGLVSPSHPTHYTTHANVDSTSVIICDSAVIKGNVFGGSANGHVLAGTRVLVEKGTNTKNKKPVIGTDGFQGEGLVFGGGQGTSSSATAGRVGGHTKVIMTDGTVYGNLYGGGLVARTGVGVNGWCDGFMDEQQVYDSIHHGLARVEVSGGTIGNLANDNGLSLLLSDQNIGNIYGGGRGDIDNYFDDNIARVANASVSITDEPVIYGAVFGGGQMANVGYWNDYASWYTEKTGATNVSVTGTPEIGTALEFDHDHYAILTGDQAPKWTWYDTINGMRGINHTCTGNVFGGGQGEVTYDATAGLQGLGGMELGHCRTTYLNISGTPRIMSSVFGGSDQGAVWGDTHVNISGGTIGTPGIHYDSLKYVNNHWVFVHANNTYNFGSVYGGSYGLDSYYHLKLNNDANNAVTQKVIDSINAYVGRIYGKTNVRITGGSICSSVYGGSNFGSVEAWPYSVTPLVDPGKTEVYVGGTAIVGPLDGTGLNANVYGGGRGVVEDPNSLRKKFGNVNSTDVTIETGSTGHVWGNVYGGSADGHVLSDTKVTLKSGTIGTDGMHDGYDGNIFGGGRGTITNHTSGRVGGNTEIEMTNGTVLGNIYGSGRLAMTGVDVNGDMQTDEGDNKYGNTKVMVKGGTVGNASEIEEFTYFSMGNIYGGGKGILERRPSTVSAETSLLLGLTKNTAIEISDTLGNNTHVYGIVLGGGEVANVGAYRLTKDSDGNITKIAVDKGTGLAQVTISGGIIGGDKTQMRTDPEDAEDPDNFWLKYNDDLGYVYGGGEGVADDPAEYERVVDTSLVDLMATVQSTKVTICNGKDVHDKVSTPWVKASVFGGSESGHVKGNAEVTISGGQIGAVYDKTSDKDKDPYGDVFVDPSSNIITDENALEGTYHWEFGKDDGHGHTVYNPFDLVLLKQGIQPSDGKSWFGNVFGGGSGWFPYVKKNDSEQYQCYWNPLAGKVWGDTKVTITGGHILNNVYGANESTDVGGKATIEMSGGTVGVPRTNEDIIDLPVMGYLFGGGCGDPRPETDGINNVGSTDVTITGGIIYGSALGGAEDGHVLGNAEIHVGQDDGKTTVIGTSGCTGVDGNIFGGGRNFLRLTYAAGRVGGNTTVEITNGKVLGSVYGGGRNALVGFSGSFIPTGETNTYQALQNGDYGKTTVMIKGGTIGDPRFIETWTANSLGDVFGGGKGSMEGIVGRPESSALLVSMVKNTDVQVSQADVSTIIYGNVYGGGEVSNVGNYSWVQSGTNVTKIDIVDGTGEAKVSVTGGRIGVDRMKMSYQLIGGDGPDKYMPATTSVGNVFGGGEGISADPSGYSSVNTKFDGDKKLIDLMASVGSTKVTIGKTASSAAWVKGSVYGGGAMGHVFGDSKVTISGGQIGAGDNGISDVNPYNNGQFVDASTTTITDGNALHSTYHWEYEASTLHPFDLVAIYNGITGEGRYPQDYGYKPTDGKTWFGNVYGGGSGFLPYIKTENGVDHCEWNRESGRVYGNSTVEITGGHILSCVYGGCETTSVGMYTYNPSIHGEEWSKGGTATVTMSGGTIGVPRTATQIDAHPIPGYLYGSGKGDPRIYFNTWTNVNTSNVTIEGGKIYGSVFGGGEDGHVMSDVTLSISETKSQEPTVIGCGGFSSADGNVFGGGRGTTTEALTAGTVSGNVTLTVTGGTVLNSVYGGGSQGSVGTYLVDKYIGSELNPLYGQIRPDAGGKTYGYTYVTIGSDTEQSNIEIGHNALDEHDLGGNVYGGGKGIAGSPTSDLYLMARVKQATVNIKEKGAQTWIEGSVFGSGEDGHIIEDTYVNIHGGQIGGHDYGDLTPCNDPYHGNVYGGGRGLDTWTDGDGHEHYSLTAGKVYGNSNVNVYGGHIIRNVYGGGNIASIGEYDVNTDPDTGAVIDTIGPTANTGLATVRILGGTVGLNNNTDNDHGNVFGSSHGIAGHDYKDLAFVHNTIVEVDGDAEIYGSVFGGGEDGHVTMNTVVNVSGGTIGFSGNNEFHGNVYGGGRGIVDAQGSISPTAGVVYGMARVNIKQSETYNTTPTIYHNVYGGGSASVVHVSKRVNVSAGEVKGSVFGGSRHIPTERENKSPRFVNMWGGTVDGDVYGCSYQGTDGDEANDKLWASFINLSGGTVMGSVYGAGYQGEVKGSVGVLIGKNAIENAPTLMKNADSLRYVPSTLTNALDIRGSVFGGSNFAGSQTTQPWRTFDVTGYSSMYIDGTGYKTGTTGSNPEMNIRRGLYGSGTNCESGAAGRDIVIRNYGERNMYHAPSGGKDIASDSLASVTRTLTTIQRVGNLYMDNANIALTGARDISELDGQPNTYYGVYQVDTSMVVSNGSSIVLGNAADPAHIVPAYIDSVKVLRSVRLDDDIYSKFFLPKLRYTWIGVKDTREDIGLDVNFYYNGEETPLNRETQENVIIFKGLSQLFVRYHIRNENQYGELQGFFRMSSPYKPRGTESFAYARQKVTSAKDANTADGGFASYFSNYNFFTDNGTNYTKTKQYPYTNIIADPVLGECRGWFIPDFGGNKWYVDGTGTRGGNNSVFASNGGGRYPDKPKLTIVGSNDVTNQIYSIMGDPTLGLGNGFNSETDIIYVVGAVSGVKELVGNTSGKLSPNASHSTLPLRLYRYPGGHKMSPDDGGGMFDGGPGYSGDGSDGCAVGPGPWYGTLLSLDNEGTDPSQIMANKTLVLDSVMIDGLHGVAEMTPAEIAEHEINVHVPSTSYYHEDNTTDPLATVNKGTLLMKGNTELKRGYNNHDAAANVGTTEAPNYNFYVNPDFNNSVVNGGGVYVAPDASAKVQVEGIVTITGNKQKKGSGTIWSNVYLPTFDKSIEITNELDASSIIGVTSPNRNTAKYYWDNTFSPVAVGVRSGNTGTISNSVLDAKAAWTKNIFRDDQGWFFSNNASKDTYYLEMPTGKDDHNGTINENTVYFGWTWANVVRTQPAGYTEVDNDITISSEEGLAWLISQTTDINSAALTNFSGKTISLTNDLNLRQYVWVPIGSEISNEHNRKFSGTFDGRGHLIDSLFIEYTSLNDHRYGRTNYGLFGNVDGGKIKRTFVVGGLIQPGSTPGVSRADGPYNIGGLVGCLEGENALVSGSEAALKVNLPNSNDVVVGGLVGLMSNGEVHSSMAMPKIVMGDPSTGLAGGLVGKVENGKVNNSFVNAQFSISGITGKYLGGLLGSNANATVANCYVNMHDNELPENANFDGIVNQVGTYSSIDYVYVMPGQSFNPANAGTHSKNFTAVIGSDNLGYQYYDNVIPDDTTLVARLNINAYRLNRGTQPEAPSIDSTYAHWARPGLAELNGDLPVLLLSEFDGAEAYKGGFRSVGTYAGDHALQYGGPARDGDNHDLSDAMKRENADASKNDYLFVYGDVSETATVAAGDITQSKVSIHEDASITNNSALANCANVYVGISFDNSCGNAIATPFVNYGLQGAGIDYLVRDWHMFSTPLRNAPMGFNYTVKIKGSNSPDAKDTNVDTFTGHEADQGTYFNNIWTYHDDEFSWIDERASNECAEGSSPRYWMKTFDEGDQTTDGYFPTSRGSLFETNVSDLFITGTDECPSTGYHRYPYGMDFYAWTEPQYHWVNFKRNGPNHWHSDGWHEHLDYVTEVATNHTSTTNVNEDVLISGKGYLAAITKPTFMQSHGSLNAGLQQISMSKEGNHCTGWNLVGNPYHGYIDFNLFANTNNGVLSVNENSQPFYVVYDADTYQEGHPGTGFLYRPKDGSINGEYAGRYIHPHQGFYVQLANSAEINTLSFNENMLVGRGNIKESYFRDLEMNYPLVNLYLSSDNGCHDVTVIELDRPEWGGATKLKDLRVGNGIFYGHHGDDNYAAMFVEKGTPKVPLWFEAKEDDIYTMTWNTANGDFHSMYLIDNITGIQYDMLRNNTYQFEGHKSDYWSRFYIVFDVEDVDEHEINNFVFFNGSEWIVNGEGDLEFIDVLGHVLMHTHVDGGQTRVNLPKVAPALYFMRLTNGKECMVQKIVVK